MKRHNFKKGIAILLSVSMLFGGHVSDVSFLYASNASNDNTQSVTTEEFSTFSNADEEEVFEEGEEGVEEVEETSETYEEEQEEENVSNDALAGELSSDEEENVEDDEEEISTQSNATETFEEEVEVENIASESEANETEEVEDEQEEETTAPVLLDIEVASISVLKNEEVAEEEKQEATISEAKLEFYKRDNFGFIPSDEVFPIVKKKNNGLLKAGAPLPSSYDNREVIGESGLPVLPEVKDQAPYGTCWIFSAVGMIEASARKKGVLKTDEDSKLSEAAAGYFYYNIRDVYQDSSKTDKPFLQGDDYNQVKSGDDWREKGGLQENALMFMSNQVAITKEDDNTKYSEMDNIGPGGNKLNKEYAYKKGITEIDNVYFINKENDDLVKQAIIDHGSVGIAYYAPPFGQGGFFKQDEDGEWYLYCSNGNKSENHAVNIVGWDDNVPRDKFSSDPGGNGAWLVRNSWGTDGLQTKDGYFWLSYYDKCLYYNMLAVDTREPDKYKYNYHYDSTGGTYDIMKVGSYLSEEHRINDMNQRNPLVGNIFKVTGEENQLLEAVQVALKSANSHFKIKIYTKDTQMEHPEDGDLKHEQEVNIDFSGIHTIPLDQKVSLTLGTYYSIVLETYKHEDGIIMYCDSTFKLAESGGTVDYYNYVDANQSYTKGLRNGNWEASYNGEHYKEREGHESLYDLNYRIRGLANPGVGVFYDANGGEGVIDKQEVAAGTEVTISENTFSRTGYKFASWNTKRNGTGETMEAGQAYTINEFTQLYAQWTPINYTVKLDPGELDTLDPVTKTCTYDTAIDLSDPGFVSPYKDLVGWTKDPTGTTAQYQVDQENVKNLTSTENEEIILYAIWQQATYKLIYDGNGCQDNETTIIEEVPMNETRNVEDNMFHKTGHAFLKWNLAADGSSDDVEVGTEILNPVNKHEEYILYAQWRPNKYRISFSSPKSSSNPATIEKTYGVPVVLPIPNRAYVDSDKVFDAWRSSSAFGTPYDGTTDLTISDDVDCTLYASWRYKRFKISFDMNGVNVATPNSIYKTFGTDVTLPTPDPSAAPIGYTFVDWYKEPECTHKYTGTTDLTTVDDAEVKVYAKWAIQLVVVFNSNGKGTAPNPMDVVSGEDIELPHINVDGYTIEGWYKDQACQSGNRVGAPGEGYAITETITLYAKWVPIHYTIKFNPNTSWQTCDASTDEVTIDCEYDQEIVLSNQGFTSEGYSLAGWSTSDGENNTVVYNIGDTVSNLRTQEGEYIILYAKWVPGAYYVVFDGNGATSGSMGNQTIEVGHSANLTQNAYERTGHYFVGWTENQDGSGTVYADKASYSKVGAAKDQEYTLYAKWEANTYTIKYNIPQDYKLDTTYNIPDTSATYGQDVTLQTVDASKIKYATFNKWKLDTTEYDAGQTLTTALTDVNNGIVTFDATFNSHQFSVNFHKTTPSNAVGKTINGDTNNITNIKYRNDDTNTFNTVGLQNVGWTMSGYTLSGWALTEDDAKNAVSKIDHQNKSTNDFVNALGITLTNNQTIDLYSVWTIYTPPTPTPQPQSNNNSSSSSSGGGGSSGSSDSPAPPSSQQQSSQPQSQQQQATQKANEAMSQLSTEQQQAVTQAVTQDLAQAMANVDLPQETKEVVENTTKAVVADMVSDMTKELAKTMGANAKLDEATTKQISQAAANTAVNVAKATEGMNVDQGAMQSATKAITELGLELQGILGGDTGITSLMKTNQEDGLVMSFANSIPKHTLLALTSNTSMSQRNTQQNVALMTNLNNKAVIKEIVNRATILTGPADNTTLANRAGLGQDYYTLYNINNATVVKDYHGNNVIGFNKFRINNEDKYYYLKDNGEIATGWVKDAGGNIYFFKPNGEAAVSKISYDNVEYEFDNTGKLISKNVDESKFVGMIDLSKSLKSFAKIVAQTYVTVVRP